VAAPPVAVAVEGTDGALWVQAPQLGSGWHSLGGKILGPPAVVALPGTGSTPAAPLFFAVGTNDELFARTLTSGWQALGGQACYSVGAVADAQNSYVTVACRGLYNHLWTNYASEASSCSGLPCFSNIATDLGGVLAAAPAVSPFDLYVVTGTNGEVFTSTGTANDFTGSTWRCIGQPGVSGYLAAAGQTTVFGCQGTDHTLFTATQSGSTWTHAVSLGGKLIGGPAVVATSSVTEFFAVGTDHAVWERTLSGGWTRLGGGAIGGVAAVALG